MLIKIQHWNDIFFSPFLKDITNCRCAICSTNKFIKIADGVINVIILLKYQDRLYHILFF